MTNTTDYITIETAALTAREQGQFWELHPEATILADIEDEGFIVGQVELTDRAAITDMETLDYNDGDTYMLWANQDGEKFSCLTAVIDADTLVRLVDAR